MNKWLPTVTFEEAIRAARAIGITIDEPHKGLLRASKKPVRISPERRRPQWVSKALAGPIHTKGRNSTCFKLACYLFKHYPKQQVIETVSEWARTKCDQPVDSRFSEEEALATIESAYKTIIRRTKC